MGGEESVAFCIVTIAKQRQKVCPVTHATCWQAELPGHRGSTQTAVSQVSDHKCNNKKTWQNSSLNV